MQLETAMVGIITSWTDKLSLCQAWFRTDYYNLDSDLISSLDLKSFDLVILSGMWLPWRPQFTDLSQVIKDETRETKCHPFLCGYLPCFCFCFFKENKIKPKTTYNNTPQRVHLFETERPASNWDRPSLTLYISQ